MTNDECSAVLGFVSRSMKLDITAKRFLKFIVEAEDVLPFTVAGVKIHVNEETNDFVVSAHKINVFAKFEHVILKSSSLLVGCFRFFSKDLNNDFRETGHVILIDDGEDKAMFPDGWEMCLSSEKNKDIRLQIFCQIVSFAQSHLRIEEDLFL